jgi:hypothetical protein
MPIPAMTIRSLGATKPSRPRAELGMNVGAMIADAAAVFRNCLRAVLVREVDFAFVIIIILIVLTEGSAVVLTT